MDPVIADTNRYYSELAERELAAEEIEEQADWLIEHRAFGEIGQAIREGQLVSSLVAAVVDGKFDVAMEIIENAAYQYAAQGFERH